MDDDRDENPFEPPPPELDWIDSDDDRVYCRGFLHGCFGGFVLCFEIIAFLLWLFGY